MLHAVRLKDGKKIDEQDIILDDKSNYQKAELIFNLLDKYRKQEISEEEDVYFINKVSITTAYRDGTFGGEELKNTLYREGYELGSCHIDNIISIKCEHNNQSEQLCFSGRIDNDATYEFDLEIKPNEEYINEIINEEEQKQLEEWTSLKCTDIVFDSDVDNWSPYTTVLNERIIGKKQLVFLIEDEDGEIFGYYLNTQVVEKYYDCQETDDKSFHFNLQSNGRLKQPMKFEIKDLKKGGYYLYEKSEKYFDTSSASANSEISDESEKCITAS